MAEVTDDDLVQMYVAGDADAFEILFLRHYGAVYRVALCLLRDVHKAEDALQEAFVCAARAASGYVPRGQFRAWLVRIARNRCLNRLDAERPLRLVAGDDVLDIVDPPAPGPSPFEQAAGDEALRALIGKLDALPERQREAITLHAREQMSYREIALVMETPLNTVKTLIRRARMSLAAALVAEDKEAGDAMQV